MVGWCETWGHLMTHVKNDNLFYWESDGVLSGEITMEKRHVFYEIDGGHGTSDIFFDLELHSVQLTFWPNQSASFFRLESGLHQST